MRQTLILHPHSLCPAVKRIVVEVDRPSPTALKLHYNFAGAIGEVRLPGSAQAARTPGLWQHTCFELFLRPRAGTGYMEFNFSPSTQWAAYEFTDYRSGMTEAPDGFQPAIRFLAGKDGLALTAEIDGLPELDWRLGLSAVIEERDGSKSYWALAHPPGAPDFHHPDCFVLELPAPEGP